MTIWQILARAAAVFPDQLALVADEVRLTYREVAARAAATAHELRARGLGRGDRLLVLDVNSPEFFEVYYAAAALGAIAVPVNYRLSPAEVAHVAAHSGARLAATRRRFASLLAGTALDVYLLDDAANLPPTPAPLVPAPVAADDVAHLYYTSGTTGRPRGVMLTHRNVCTHALGAIAELQLRAADRWGHFAPMFHLADAWATFAITWVGGCHVMLPAFEPAAALCAIAAHRVTVTNLVPTMLNLMVQHPAIGAHDCSSLRLVLSGGAPIAPALVARVVEAFRCEYVQTYGLTETSPYLTLSVLPERLRGRPAAEQLAWRARTGRPFITVELQVVDEQGVPVPADDAHVGEIEVRGDTVTPGYWNDPAATAAAFHEGWLKTGDLAVVDGAGSVNIVDRAKDMIITGGENVYSIEVEHVLYQHPAVSEAAVFGVPDETWGEAVRAAVVLRPGTAATAAEIVAFCRARLAAFKAPRAVDFLDALPRTGSGKIQKRALRDPYWAGSARVATPPLDTPR